MNSPAFNQTIGNIAALASACAWAAGAIFFRKLGDKASPLGMNLGKCVIGVIYLGITLLFTSFSGISIQAIMLLGVSGLLGIALADTFFFKALIDLGPRQILMLETLSPVFTVILAISFLGERPQAASWLGMLLILAGTGAVLWEHSQKERINKRKFTGIKYAILFVICNSLGIILAKIAVVSISALQATFIRLLWGVIGLSIWGGITRQLKEWVSPFKDIKTLKLMLLSAFIVIFGGFLLSIAALKYTSASIATILNSTTPLFILPLSAIFFKEKISFSKIISAGLVVAGVVLLICT